MQKKRQRTQEDKRIRQVRTDVWLCHPSLVNASFKLCFFLHAFAFVWKCVSVSVSMCVWVRFHKHTCLRKCYGLSTVLLPHCYIHTNIDKPRHVVIAASFYNWELSICLFACHKCLTSGRNDNISACAYV